MLDWLKGAALVAFIGLCISTSYTVISVGKHISNTLMDTNDTISKLNTEIDELHHFTLEAALTASEARKASIKESKMLDVWNQQIAATLTSVQNVMFDTHLAVQSIQATSSTAQDTLRATTQTIQSLQVPIAQVDTTLADLQPVLLHIDRVVGDGTIQATFASVANTTAHLDATTLDIQEQVHKWTHPGIWTKLKGFALDVAHVFNPL